MIQKICLKKVMSSKACYIFSILHLKEESNIAEKKKQTESQILLAVDN